MSGIAVRRTKAAGLLALALSAAAPAAAGSNAFASQFPGHILAAHNAVRAQAGVAPLIWDNALGNSAAVYAQRLALTNTFQHSDRKARRGIGENLWMGSRGGFSVEQMVGNWASERRVFAAGIFPAVSRTGNWADVGHYTQIVWPTTTRIGCALASNGRADYLVCHYSPAGNIDGRPVGPATGARSTARR